MRWHSCFVIATCALSACEPAPTQVNDCTALTAHVLPGEPVLAIGDTATLSAAYDAIPPTCTPSVPAAALRWSSTDPSIVSVDSTRGVARALAAGAAQVSVHEPGSLTALGGTPVTVFEPLFGRIIYTRIQNVACLLGGGLCRPALWTMAPDGSDPTLLLDSLTWPEHPRVSPDGRTVVYEDEAKLYFVDGAGRHKRLFETGLPDGYDPSWSPDGHWILFFATDSATATAQVFVIRPDGTGRRRVTSFEWAGFPAWSPDGGAIVFVRARTDSAGQRRVEAVTMDTGGTSLRVVSDTVTSFGGREPAWSPDGSAILFLDSQGTQWVIKRLTITTLQYDLLADAQGNRPGNWSPDGKLIVYGTGDLWLMNADGTNQHVVRSDSTSNFEAAWTPARPPQP